MVLHNAFAVIYNNYIVQYLKWHYAQPRIKGMQKTEIQNNCIFCKKCAH